jgi:hypothetical protein
MRISSLFKRLRRLSSQAFRKRHSSDVFRNCRNAGNSVLTAEGTTSKGTGSISCEVEYCIFYRLSLRTLRTKDVTPTAVTLQVVYRTVVILHVANKRVIRYGNKLNIVCILCVILDLQ